MRVFREVGEWVRECRRLPTQDLDNVMLVTGAEGSGKSVLALQLAKALDPSFSLENVSFSIGDFIKLARRTERGRCVVSDEFLANKRKAMHGGTIQLLDFLQECRGLNLHLIICFPHFDLLDKAVRDHRVRWHIHIPHRGFFQVREKYRYFQPGGVEAFGWRVVGNWNYKPLPPESHEAYKVMKQDHMTKRGEVEAPEDESVTVWDMQLLASLPGKYLEASGARSGKLV